VAQRRSDLAFSTAGWSIDFSDPQTPLGRSEYLDVLRKELELGLTSDQGFVQGLEGGGTSQVIAAAREANNAMLEDVRLRAEKIALTERTIEAENRNAESLGRLEEKERATLKASAAAAKAHQQYWGVVKGAAKDVGGMAVNSLANFAGGIWAAADAAIQGGEGLGAALSKMLKSTLLAIAQEATVRSVFELAMGFAALFTNPPAAGAHFTAAGIFGAAAVAAGSAGLAMSAAGVGSSPTAAVSAGGGSSYGGSSSGDTYSPRNESTKIVVEITYDRADPAAQLVASRRLAAAMRQAA